MGFYARPSQARDQANGAGKKRPDEVPSSIGNYYNSPFVRGPDCDDQATTLVSRRKLIEK